MAITARAAGTWSAAASTTFTPSIPAGAQSGDMMLLLWGGKPYTVTTSCDNSWVEIGSAANGTTGVGNGTGSMLAGAYYKVHTGTESNPTLTFSGTGQPGFAVIVVFQKDPSESWVTPVGAGGGDTSSNTSFSATMGSDPGITAGDCVVANISITDDTTMTVPTFTTAGVTYGTVAEYPTSALSTTTSFDASADACYRIASSGTSSAAPVVTATLSSSETGTAWLTRLRVEVVATDHALASGVTGSATTSGAMKLQASLASGITGTASTTGALGVVHPIASSITATASTTGTLGIAKAMAGDLSGTASTTGTLGITVPLAGAVSGSASTSGSVTAALALASALSGTASTTGNLTRTTPLAGDLTASASLTGAMDVTGGGTDHALGGAITASASVTGAVYRSTPLSGTLSASASTSAALTLASALGGSLTATSSVTAALTLAAALSAAPSASASLTGSLTVGQINTTVYGTARLVAGNTSTATVSASARSSATVAVGAIGSATVAVGNTPSASVAVNDTLTAEVTL